jgi:hypothetical protein
MSVPKQHNKTPLMPTCMASVGMARNVILRTPLMRTHVHVYKHGVVVYIWELRTEN